MEDVVKIVEIDGRKFELREPPGYEVDLFVMRYYDKDMQPIPEKIADANVHLIKMCFGLPEDKIKKLPNRVYRQLLNEAAAYFIETTKPGGDEGKK